MNDRINAENQVNWDERAALHVEAFVEKLANIHPAYDNFNRMSPSVRRAYTGRYLSFKTEEARQREFEKIVERLNNNLKPM
jgi:uncharacterized protein YdeI (YjbR/CyaY-like superfamily)